MTSVYLLLFQLPLFHSTEYVSVVGTQYKPAAEIIIISRCLMAVKWLAPVGSANNPTEILNNHIMHCLKQLR